MVRFNGIWGVIFDPLLEGGHFHLVSWGGQGSESHRLGYRISANQGPEGYFRGSSQLGVRHLIRKSRHFGRAAAGCPIFSPLGTASGQPAAGLRRVWAILGLSYPCDFGLSEGVRAHMP